MITKDKTKPTLLARKNYRGNKLRLEVKIALNDDCNNGHADFSITASGYEYDRGRWIDTFGGCCHGEILKRFPDLKNFVDLHLSDSTGAPMYATENGFYHLYNKEKTQAEREKITKRYLRITEAELKQLAKVEDIAYFKYTLEALKIPQRWKKEADQAIKVLEKMAGKKWVRSYKWKRSQYTPITKADKKALDDRINSGYYTAAATKKREAAKNERKRVLKIEEIYKKAKAECKKALLAARLDIWLIEKAEALTKKDRTKTFLMDPDNPIYYNHTNNLCFNWRGYGAQLTEKNFKKFCDSITEAEFQKILPKDIVFTLKEGEKTISTFKK